MALEMRHGKVSFLWDTGSGHTKLEYPNVQINNDKWHRINATRCVTLSADVTFTSSLWMINTDVCHVDAGLGDTAPSLFSRRTLSRCPPWRPQRPAPPPSWTSTDPPGCLSEDSAVRWRWDQHPQSSDQNRSVQTVRMRDENKFFTHTFVACCVFPRNPQWWKWLISRAAWAKLRSTRTTSDYGTTRSGRASVAAASWGETPCICLKNTLMTFRPDGRLLWLDTS